VWYKRHYLVPLHGVSTAVLPLLKFQPSYLEKQWLFLRNELRPIFRQITREEMRSAIDYRLLSAFSALRICPRHWCSFAVYSSLLLQSCIRKYFFLTRIQQEVLFPCKDTSRSSVSLQGYNKKFCFPDKDTTRSSVSLQGYGYEESEVFLLYKANV
jgi:hypothetical protein